MTGLLTAPSGLPTLEEYFSAEAATALNELVFEQNNYSQPSNIILRKANGSQIDLTASINGGAWQPSLSPDGSRIAFVTEATDLCPGPHCSPNGTGPNALHVMNSDGSGIVRLTGADFDVNTNNYSDNYPRWSPDGSRIAFSRSSGGGYSIYSISSAGTSLTRLTATSDYSDASVSWSPDGTRLAYSSYRDSGRSQIYIMAADGTDQHRLTSTIDAHNNAQPSWSPDGSRIYFQSDESGGLSYYASSNGFTDTNVSRSTLTTESFSRIDEMPVVSKDGQNVYYSSTASGYPNIFKVSASGGIPENVANEQRADSNPSVALSAYPAAPPSNATVTVGAPSPNDAPYTRQITVGLSSAGVQRFEYGWSSSSTTAPNTSYLQTITNMTTKKGPLNFLGKYSGNGTTWNGGTQPDQDWYLWVRAYKTSGGAQAWGTPLKVHTPRRPLWVGLGDSFSSGHHQDADEPYCPTTEDAPTYYAPGETLCIISGAPHLTPNDLAYSWVKKAVDASNVALHAPASWSYGLDLVALSGAPTSNFGVYNTTPGTDAWASGTAQSAYMRADLYPRYDSWNVVSMTGGANDTNWQEQLKQFYQRNFVSANPAPWSVSTSTPSVDCPDSQAVWNWLKAAQLDGQTLDVHIQANLQGVVTAATRYSPGVRVLNVGYPYVVNSTNVCFGDSGSWHGSKSVIDSINTDHAAVTGANVRYINLTAASAFGLSPASAGYIQLYRLNGYPHPTSAGQTVISNTAVAKATASTW